MTLAVLLASWFAVVTVLGARGAFVTAPGVPPLPVLVAFAVPLAAFYLALRLSPRFRRFVLGLDLRLLSAMQAWRFVGFGFVALYANGVLPGFFAWPAGLGDVAVAAAAPWVVMRLVSNPGFARGGAFALWNWLGILDLAVAVSAGVLSSGLVPALTGELTTAPMARLPLIYIPALLVPIMIMLHWAALLQVRGETARSSPPQAGAYA